MDSLDVSIRLVKREDAAANKAIILLFKRLYNGEIDECMQPFDAHFHSLSLQGREGSY